MAINLGEKPPADYAHPIEMMKDCHRRVEHFLNVLRKVHAQFGAGELTDEARRALEVSLNYFANFAPHHTADEEESLFPRLRSSRSAEVREVTAELDRLERDHRRGEANHARVDELVRQWLARGRIDEAERECLRRALDELTLMYADHIQLEEQRVFFLASRVLMTEQIREIGEEMKRRRSLNGAGPTSAEAGGKQEYHVAPVERSVTGCQCHA